MIRLIVDSASDYNSTEITKRKVDMVPIQIAMGGDNYLDGVNLTKDKFYDMLVGTKEFPKTSQPSPEAYLSLFKDAKEKGDEVLCITLSSALSGTYQSALIAKQMADYDGIYLIDTLSATAGIRLLAEKAVSLIEEGKSVQEIVDILEEAKGRIVILAAVDTLEYLCMGGRVSKTVATVGSLANIKPIVTVTSEGKVDVIGKKRGTSKAMNFIVDCVKELDIDYDFDVYTIYTYGEDGIDKLETELKDVKKTARIQIGPTIGAHVGPGAFGIIFIKK